jgi:hypothetical protein
MHQYLAEITLPVHSSADYMHLIPQQRAYVEGMFKRGKITSYALALDRSKIWATFFTATPEEAERIIQKFPIAEYISYTIHELAFMNSMSTMVPAVSLN